MPANTLFSHPNQNRGEELPGVSQGAETQGQTISHYEQEVDVKFKPSFTPTFGRMAEKVVNEKNRRRGRLSFDTLDTDDLFVPVKKQVPFKQGGVGLEIATSIEDATGGTPDPDPDTLLQVSSEVTPIDRAHAQKVTTTVDSWEVFSTIDFKDGSAFGQATQEDHQIKDPAFSMPAADWLTIVSKLENQGDGKSLYSRKDIASWPVFVDRDEEEETGLEILTTRTVVNRAALPAITMGAARHYRTLKNLDQHKALYVDREIDADILTVTLEEWHNTKFYFPAYLDATNPFSAVTVGNQVVISVNKSSDHEFSLPCLYQTTFQTASGSVDEVFQFKPVDVSFSTPPVRENNVLVDEGVATFYIPYQISTATDGTPVYDYAVLAYGISASSPTTTEYLALMGTTVLIADEVTRWKFNLWKRTKVFMKIPDLSLGLSGYLSY